jgi:hypothetical protein
MGAFALVVSACAQKDNSAAKSDSATAASAAQTAPASTTAPQPNVVTVHAKDFSFNGPAQVPAGMTTFRLINDGAVPHHITLIRLDSGKTVADLKHALALPAAPPAWAHAAGGPNAVGPGGTDSATVDLVPGNYAMVCFVDFPGGVPHFEKGMISALTVGAAPAGPAAAAPAVDDTIKLTDFAFDVTKPITSGMHSFEVQNLGGQAHEVVVVRLAPHKTIPDLLAWMSKPAGPPPADMLGGVSGFQGAPTYFSMNFTPGTYGLICFYPDVKTGKLHFALGMTKTFTVM